MEARTDVVQLQAWLPGQSGPGALLVAGTEALAHVRLIADNREIVPLERLGPGLRIEFRRDGDAAGADPTDTSHGITLYSHIDARCRPDSALY